MRYVTKLMVYSDPKLVKKALGTDMFALGSRSGVALEEKKNHVVFTITATDSVALRGTLNGITKQLTVYEKMRKMDNDTDDNR